MKCNLLLFDFASGIYRRRYKLALAPALQTLKLIHGAFQLAHDVCLIAHNAVCSFRAGDIRSCEASARFRITLNGQANLFSNFEATADRF